LRARLAPARRPAHGRPGVGGPSTSIDPFATGFATLVVERSADRSSYQMFNG